MIWKVKLSIFEGPLDLLLFLIQRHEIDILDIPVAFITERYLEYLDLMQTSGFELASEYLRMAATLVHLKSRMLLPRSEEELSSEEEEGEDPRQELVERLLAYKRFKEAAKRLAQRPTLYQDTFLRGNLKDTEEESEEYLLEIGIFELLEVLKKILERGTKEPPYEVQLDQISIKDKISELKNLLNVKILEFESLFTHLSKREIILTFLALLEMARLRMIKLEQPQIGGKIYIRTLGNFS
jgi:segregation and condensation protein A